MARHARYNSHSAYLAREGRRQEKTAGKILVGLFIFAALYNMGSQSKVPPQQTAPVMVASTPVHTPPMEVMPVESAQSPATNVESAVSEANATDAPSPKGEDKFEVLSADTPLRPASGAHCDHDPGTAVGILNLPGHPKDGQLVCARPGDPNVSKWF